MNKRTKKLEKGITLIALVITIIVLLILAGVSIASLTGENGILNRAQTAANTQKKATYFEEINLEVLDEQAERATKQKEEAFIVSINNRVNQKEWVKSTVMCDENLNEQTDSTLNTILIVNTKEDYEIIVDINNVNSVATIRNNFEKVGEKYKISYDANGGNGQIEKQEVRQGFSVILQQNLFSKEYYTFVGWCENENGEGEVYAEGSKYKATKDTTLYAIWRQDIATITFYSNTGNGEMSDIQVGKGLETTLTKNTYTKEGYTFIKWNTQADGSGTGYDDEQKITITEDKTLYAIWQLNTYTISYNANGGRGAPANQTKKYGETLKLSTTVPTRDGYIFQGWSTTSTGSVSYIAGADYTANSGATLFAIWKSTGINAATVSADPYNFIGAGVSYTANEVDGWRILFSDSKHIYIITSYVWGNTYNSSGLSYSEISAELSNNDNWTNFVDPSVADLAYGSVPQEIYEGSKSSVSRSPRLWFVL